LSCKLWHPVPVLTAAAVTIEKMLTKKKTGSGKDIELKEKNCMI
jgi:hypothetical protein